MTPLDRLIEAVERGEWPGGIDGAARDVFPYRSARADDRGLTAAEAFDGSLDAAHALHKAVLPGLRVHDITEYRDETWSVEIQDDETGWAYSAKADTPARAWLLAILRAMKERKGECDQ